MRCPFCAADDDKVVDSRPASEGAVIRRRRECNQCVQRFTTYERVEETPLRVVKKNAGRVEFDRRRIQSGIELACRKRDVTHETIDDLVTRIERQLREQFAEEVTTEQIGEIVMRHLKELDDVAYVRFASVYKDFKDLDDFHQAVDTIRTDLLQARANETTSPPRGGPSESAGATRGDATAGESAAEKAGTPDRGGRRARPSAPGASARGRGAAADAAKAGGKKKAKSAKSGRSIFEG